MTSGASRFRTPSPSNLQKYAFQLDPHVNSRDGLPFPGFNDDSFTITYTKVLAATDLVYTVQWSTDLLTWSSAGITEEVISDDGVTQLVRASASIGTGERMFLRISLTLQ